MKKSLKIISIVMMVISVIFILFALTHPECSFPWSNVITLIIYGVYTIAMFAITIYAFRE